jgi:Pyrimidine dimer DNA glycosylase
MQTFLPIADFESSVAALDWRRLGKQRVECKQIMKALTATSGGWVNHPATVMWRGYEKALATYWLACCREWKRRGYVDNLGLEAAKALEDMADKQLEWPWWIGDERFHASHRSNLLRKDPAWYSQFGWTEPATLPYEWPRPDKTYEHR